MIPKHFGRTLATIWCDENTDITHQTYRDGDTTSTIIKIGESVIYPEDTEVLIRMEHAISAAIAQRAKLTPNLKSDKSKHTMSCSCGFSINGEMTRADFNDQVSRHTARCKDC